MLVIEIFIGLIIIYTTARNIEETHKANQAENVGYGKENNKKTKRRIEIRPERI